MSKVFVSNEPMVREGGLLRPLFNFADAMKYGDLVHLTHSGMLPSNPEMITNMIFERMPAYTDKDYLLLVGSPVAMAITVMRAAQLNNGHVALLVWHRMSRCYEVSRLHVPQGRVANPPASR